MNHILFVSQSHKHKKCFAFITAHDEASSEAKRARLSSYEPEDPKLNEKLGKLASGLEQPEASALPKAISLDRIQVRLICNLFHAQKFLKIINSM